MENMIKVVQGIIGLSVAFVWIFRFHNVEKEFKQFGLHLIVRSMVGAFKIALATLLLVGVWYPDFVLIPAILMGFFMLSAQYFHYKAKNPLLQRLPSLILLLLCLFLIGTSL
jgi:tellurite resistance protein TehA-like permease